MKTLSAPTLIATARAYAAPVLLLEITFSDPAPFTLRVSDAARVELEQEWLPLVQSWGTLEENLNPLDAGGAPATFDVTLFNTRPVASRDRLSDLLRSPGNTGECYKFEFAAATLYRIDAGLSLGDEQPLGRFFLEDPTEIDARRFRLRMSDVTLLAENKIALTTVTRTVLPNAARATVGKIIPWLFGTLKDVPCTWIVDGVAGRLAEDLDTAETVITLKDAGDWPAAGSLLVDQEIISYTGKTGNDLTGCTRAQNSTLAAPHTNQTVALEVRSGTGAYRAAVSEHAGHFGSITNIRVNGLPVVTAPGTTLNDSALIPGRHYATIDFTPGDIGKFHTIPVGKSIDLAPAGIWISASPGNGVSYIASAVGTISVPVFAERGGKTTRKVVWSVAHTDGVWPATNGIYVYRRPAGSSTWVEVAHQMGDGSVTTLVGSDSQDFPGAGDEEIYFTALIGSLKAAHMTLTAYEVSYEGTSSASTDSSTAAVVIGEVLCDVTGILDDPTGSISGVGGLLLENPTDIVKYIHLRLCPDVTPALLGQQWATTRARTAPLKWAFGLGDTGIPRYSDLRRTMGEQARCQLFTESGLVEWRYLEDDPQPIVTLSYARDVWEEAPARASRSDRTRVFNRVVASAARTAAGDYLYVKPIGPDGSDDAIETTVTYDYVQDQQTADLLVTWWQRFWRRQRWMVELVGWQRLLPYEKGDCFALVDHPVLAAHGALVFRIIRKSYLLGDQNPARIRLTAIEATP